MPAWTSARCGNQSAELCTVKSSTATVGQLVPAERRRHVRRQAPGAPSRPRPPSGRGRSGCSRCSTRSPRSSFHQLAVTRSGSRRAASRATAIAARRTSVKVHRGSIRTYTWIPRPPLVFGQPDEPELVEHRLDQSRGPRAPPRSRCRAAGRGRGGARRDGRRRHHGSARGGSAGFRGSPPRSPARPGCTRQRVGVATAGERHLHGVDATPDASRGHASGRSARPRCPRHSARGTSAASAAPSPAPARSVTKCRTTSPLVVPSGKYGLSGLLTRTGMPPTSSSIAGVAMPSTLSRRAGRRTASHSGKDSRAATGGGVRNTLSSVMVELIEEANSQWHF